MRGLLENVTEGSCRLGVPAKSPLGVIGVEGVCKLKYKKQLKNFFLLINTYKLILEYNAQISHIVFLKLLVYLPKNIRIN